MWEIRQVQRTEMIELQWGIFHLTIIGRNNVSDWTKALWISIADRENLQLLVKGNINSMGESGPNSPIHHFITCFKSNVSLILKSLFYGRRTFRGGNLWRVYSEWIPELESNLSLMIPCSSPPLHCLLYLLDSTMYRITSHVNSIASMLSCTHFSNKVETVLFL